MLTPGLSQGGFWLLLSHMKWYLGVIRDIMREAILAASGRLPSAGTYHNDI